MKKRNFIAVAACALALSSCSGFLDQKPDRIMTEDQVYGDVNLTKSVLANFYERISLGQHVGDTDGFALLDEAITYDTKDDQEVDRNWWRTYDYTLIRNINQFLKGLRESTALSEVEKAPMEGEARFIRAWVYFCTCRTLGGMPIVGDEVYDYTSGMDITTLQVPRATESAMYDYIIEECKTIAEMLPTEPSKNGARATKWAAKMLEARAAVYAGSIARYNTVSDYPLLNPETGVVGISSEKATDYYKKALTAAEEVINSGKYSLMRVADDATPQEKADNFFKAVCEKNGNTEVIWSRDYIYPGQTHGYTKSVQPHDGAEDGGNSRLSALLNLVVAFEPIATDTPGEGAKFDVGTKDNPKFYTNPEDLFVGRDPRLAGTILYPGSSFRDRTVVLQTGQWIKNSDGQWEQKLGQSLGEKDDQGRYVTALNGPMVRNDQRECNRTGFYVRKYLDKTTSAGTDRGSEMWNVYFRLSEAYLIAAEAAYELNGGSDATALKYINAVRSRAGVKELASVNHQQIMHENQVEFAFEGHRWWDLKRWRQADKIWTGSEMDITATRRGLWPFLVVSDDDKNGKWVFFEENMNRYYRNPLKCLPKHYYAELDNGWLNNNPKLVKNPYQ